MRYAWWPWPTPFRSSWRPFDAQGIRDYRDASELIADAEVGTVSVCLPHYLHFPVALEAIRAGKHVLVEKPLTISLGGSPAAGRRRGRRGRGPRRVP